MYREARFRTTALRQWIGPLLAATALLWAGTGCGTPAGVIFPEVNPPLLWPPPPDAPRIRYVGQLASEADLKPAVSAAQSLHNALFGGARDRVMVNPYALCTDGANRLFVTDISSQVVHVLNLDTRQYAQWGPGQGKKFSWPVGIAYDPSGRLLVADSEAGIVDILDNQGNLSGQIGKGILKRPCGLAFDAAGGRLFVADSQLHQVLVFGHNGALLARVGSRGTDLGQFNFPTNVALDHQGRLYVSDSLNYRIQQFGPDLLPIREIGSKGDRPGYFSQPKGIAVDSQDHLYVIDARFESVQIFDADGHVLLDFGGVKEGSDPGKFSLPAGIFIDFRNRIWIADQYNNCVQVFDYLPE